MTSGGVMTRAGTRDRVSIGALAAADVGVGLFLIAAQPPGGFVHVLAGLVGLLLALPAAAAAGGGRLPPLADEGVLVNVGVLTFMTVEILFLPRPPLEVAGLAILLTAATCATVGLYLHLAAALRSPAPGRHLA